MTQPSDTPSPEDGEAARPPVPPEVVPTTEIFVEPPQWNPYAMVMAQALPQPASPATEPAPAGPPPRIWPALLVGLFTMPLAGLISTVVMITAARAHFGDLPRAREALTPLLQQFATTRLGLVLMIVPGQLVFLLVALAAAWASSTPWRERLQLTWGRFPQWRWSWPVLALGTPMIGFVTAILISKLVDAKSENLELLRTLLRDQQGPFLWVLYLIVGILPGIAEEVVFRGYVQSRLLQRLPPWAAIGATALMFAVAHFDPVHAVSVFPLGVWLGILAWRTGSTWPAILAHAANNCLAITMAHWGEVDVNDPMDLARRGFVIVGCGYALLMAMALLAAMRTTKVPVAHV